MSYIVYFNQWFSSIGPVIADIKNKLGGSVRIIASSKNENHVYKKYVDKFIIEDWVEVPGDSEQTEKNYINYVTSLCLENNVNIFFVRKHMEMVAKNIKVFDTLGIKVIVDNYADIKTLGVKSEAYDILAESIEAYIPEYLTSDGLDIDRAKAELYKIVANSGEHGEKEWCFKLNTDEGAASFRTIASDKDCSFEALKVPRNNKMSKHDVSRLITDCTAEELQKIIFMERLHGPEYSLDCYNSHKGFIAICREKDGHSRVQRIYYNKALANVCETIGRKFSLKNPFNVQFMTDRESGEIKLLEINTRMAGGTYLSTEFGLNICEICLRDAIGDTNYSIESFRNFTEKRVTHIEDAVIL